MSSRDVARNTDASGAARATALRARFGASVSPSGVWRRGSPSPWAEDLDVRTWTQPHRLVPHRRNGLYLLAITICLLVANPPIDAYRSDPFHFTGSTLGFIHDYRLEGLITLAAVSLVWAFLTWWWTGTLTIDPVRRELSWQRPRDRGRAEPQVWRYDQLVGARRANVRIKAFLRLSSVTPTVSFDPWTTDDVRIDLGTRSVLVRVPIHQGQRFTDSLNAVAKGG